MYRWFPSILEVLVIIRPETLVHWHRAGFRHYWRWKSRSPGGRPQIEAVCLSKIKPGHIGGAARRELGGKESAQPCRRRGRTPPPPQRRDAGPRHCNISCMTAAGDGGGTRRARQRGRGIPVGSNRPAVGHILFALG